MPEENPQNADMEQIRPYHHPAFIEHLTCGGAPGVLPVVVAQPAAKEKHRRTNVRVDIVKKDVQISVAICI